PTAVWYWHVHSAMRTIARRRSLRLSKATARSHRSGHHRGTGATATWRTEPSMATNVWVRINRCKPRLSPSTDSTFGIPTTYLLDTNYLSSGYQPSIFVISTAYLLDTNHISF